MRGKGRPSRHTQIAACAHEPLLAALFGRAQRGDHVRSRGRADLPTSSSPKTSSSTSENDPNSDLRTAGLNSQQSRLLQRGFTANLLVFGWAGKPGVNMARLGPVAQAAGALTIILVCTAGANAQITDKPPFWAYTYNPPDFKPPPDDGQPRHVSDSTASYTVPQTRDRFLAPDWHPGDHPAMPAVVANGRQPDVYACDEAADVRRRLDDAHADRSRSSPLVTKNQPATVGFGTVSVSTTSTNFFGLMAENIQPPP